MVTKSIDSSLGISHKYTLLKRIALTQMSEIWLAHPGEMIDGSLTKSPLILKIARVDNPESAWINQTAILNESKWLTHLNHQNIAKILPLVGGPQRQDELYHCRATMNGSPLFFAEMYLSGETLSELVHARGKLDLGTALKIIKSLAKALTHLHDQNGVHCDIKPSNILFKRPAYTWSNTQDIMPVLIDFGIATDQGSLIVPYGSKLWMAPEYRQASKNQIAIEAIPAWDIYSLGAILYYMLTGDLLDESKLMPSLLSIKSRPNINSHLYELIQQTLHKDTKKRPTVGELSAEINALINIFSRK